VNRPLLEAVVEIGEIKLEVDVLLARAEGLLRMAGQRAGVKAVEKARKAVGRVLSLEVETLGEISVRERR
jgi:hypothetical protein